MARTKFIRPLHKRPTTTETTTAPVQNRTETPTAPVQKRTDTTTAPVQKRIETTTAKTAQPPTKKIAVCRDYEFEDGDDQMWHAKWCLDSWNKPGSKTLLLFQWDCQDEPTWEPYEGHNEDSCLAADFFYWLPDRPRPAGWQPPTGWTVPVTRPPIEWFEAEDAARQRWPQLWEPATLEAKLRSLEPRARPQKASVRARSAGKIKAQGAKKKLFHDCRRSPMGSPSLKSHDQLPSLAEIESTWGLRKGKGRR